MGKTLAENLTVDQVLARYPQTATVFLHRQMACVGCELAGFETLAEAAAVYRLQVEHFIDELEQAIQPPESPDR